MPAATSSKVAGKRKRDAGEGKPRKRARSESVSSADDADETSLQDRILSLEKEILESKKHYNNIVVLLETARAEVDDAESDDDDDENDGEGPELTASVALCRVFLRLLAAGSLTAKKTASEKEATVAKWLRERLTEYEDVLVGMMGQSGDLASTALTLSMRLLQAEGRYLRASPDEPKGKTDKDSKRGKKKEADSKDDSSAYYFPYAFLRRLVHSLLAVRQRLGADVSEALADEFVEKYVSEYHDVRFYTFKAVATVLRPEGEDGDEDGDEDESESHTAEAAFYLLAQLDDVPGDKEALEEFFVQPGPPKRSHALMSVPQHKRQAQDAWVALLGGAGAAEKGLRKRALAAMEGTIAPWFVRPELLLDYLTDCYNAGGSTSLLALSGLYYLIRERNVDYPAFYPKLYSLLDGTMLHSKHRPRFLRLLDTFLDSTHLPAQLIASFVKRLARLCLHAPPSAIVCIVPWLYNLFRKHPLCTFMLHRVPRTAAARAELARSGFADPFRADEADPMETQAIDSCLWEVVQLQTHYHPNVATIAKILSEQFTKQSYNMEDFLDHSYQSMFEAELGKEVKKTPVVEFHIPKRIFLPQDPASGVEDGVLVKLWDFA